MIVLKILKLSCIIFDLLFSRFLEVVPFGRFFFAIKLLPLYVKKDLYENPGELNL